jgi:hypothetical protein
LRHSPPVYSRHVAVSAKPSTGQHGADPQQIGALPGLAQMVRTPVKAGKTGRIIDLMLNFARVISGKSIYIK